MDMSDHRWPWFYRRHFAVSTISRFLLATGLIWGLLSGVGPLSAAHPDDPLIKAAIQKAVTYLKTKAPNQQNGYNALCVYALLKAKVPASDSSIQSTLAKIVGKVKSTGKYSASVHDVYEAGVDLMALEAADAEKYKSQIAAITKYLLDEQAANGSWDYPGNTNNGDTSITQYAMLGLWAARRAGVEVPLDSWNRAVQWFLKWQLKNGDINGAFAYHPAATVAGDLDRNPSHSMTAAASGSLMVARLFLHPNARGLGTQKAKQGGNPRIVGKKKFGGVLQSIDFDSAEEEKKKPAKAKPEPMGSRVAVGAIDGSVKLGYAWLNRFYTVSKVRGLQKWPLYYLYALERMCALAEIEKFGSHDWYAEGATRLAKSQKADGSWIGQAVAVGTESSGTPEATSFAVLFLTKSTAAILNKSLGVPDPLGAGLQAGGRGLSGDLSLVEEKNGQVKAKKVVLPIDKLLAELENPKTLSIGDTQKALVESVQIGDREKLIGQKERLKALAGHPSAEIRRTAFWALGRCEDLSVVPLLLKALDDDDLHSLSPGVMIEARNALCSLARKPRGIFVKGRPYHASPNGLLDDPEGASAAKKKAAISEWRRQVRANWKRWYFRFRPYTVRDDLDELIFSATRSGQRTGR
jgi:hypothetical protein